MYSNSAVIGYWVYSSGFNLTFSVIPTETQKYKLSQRRKAPKECDILMKAITDITFATSAPLRENKPLNLEFKQVSGHTKNDSKCQIKSEPPHIWYRF